MATIEAHFGRYALLKELAIGGMAEIFLAQRLSFGDFARFVVIKRLLPEHRGEAVYEQLFLEEARIAAALEHRNIVSVHDLGRMDDAFFMVMEYVHGISGAELLTRSVHKNGRVALGAALTVARDIAEALEHGYSSLGLDNHPMGVIHHDVSPHNIQIGYDGSVKLLDYGVATQIGRSSPRGRRGKFAYMSPEAVSQAPLDHRSDLFSLGIVLYEMSVGRRLFKSKSPHETMQRIKRAQVKRPSDIVPDFPPALESFLGKALAGNPNARFQSGLEFAHELEAIGASLGLELTQDALSAHLQQLFADEIALRWKELIEHHEAAAQGAESERVSSHLIRLKQNAPDDHENAPTPTTDDEGGEQADTDGPAVSPPTPMSDAQPVADNPLFLERQESAIIDRPTASRTFTCDLPPGVNDLDPDWRIDALDEQIASDRVRMRVLLLAALASSILLLWFNL
ncbi:MAG: serine/threonine-protein kinase [Myxococcota bacterium]|nr:serine/threonine-protein kinase [Myxococcota bacterium]